MKFIKSSLHYQLLTFKIYPYKAKGHKDKVQKFLTEKNVKSYILLPNERVSLDELNAEAIIDRLEQSSSDRS